MFWLLAVLGGRSPLAGMKEGKGGKEADKSAIHFKQASTSAPDLTLKFAYSGSQ